MQVKLVTNGGYVGLPEESLGKPVEAHEGNGKGIVGILGAELIRIGGLPKAFEEDYSYHFFLGTEVERV